MKNIFTIAIITLALLACTAPGGFAQAKNEIKKEQYRLRLVENVNGKQQVIDRTFNSKEEMEAFMEKEHKDMPAIAHAPEAPTPPTAPTPPSPPAPMEKCSKEKHCNKECRKIVITEDISRIDKDDEEDEIVKIITKELGEEEQLEIEKEIASAKGGEVKVIIIKKSPEIRKNEKGNGRKEITIEGPEERVIEERGAGIGNLKLYPNPSNEQFHIEFNMDEGSDVKIRLSDINGKEIYTDQLKNFNGHYEKDIPRGDKGAGTYILDVETNTEKQTRRVVVQ